jgi:hypothetical protein
MKKALYVFFALALVLGLAVSPVSAAAPVDYESSIQVRNLSADAGEITLVFYDLTGAPVGAPVVDPIAGNETLSYYQGTMPVVDGFDGSVVVSSLLPIAAMSNLVGLNSTGGQISYAAYGGFSAGTTTVYLPTLFKDNWGYNTFYYVQNTGGVATDVAITYSDGTTNSITGLLPGQSAVVKQADETHTPKVFSATLVAASADIAVTVVEEGNTLFAYDGFGTGATMPLFPLVNENNYGYFTGIQIQNTGATDTIVTVDYTPSLAGTACFETRTVPAGSSATFAQFVFYAAQTETDPNFATDCTMGETFVGSGAVSGNTESIDLVAVINQLEPASNKGGAYGGFDGANGQASIIYPLIMDRNYGYFTSWSIVNVGSTAIAIGELDCNVTGTDGLGNPVNTTISNDAEIAINGSWTLNHANLIANGFVGGATCVGPAGAMLVGTSNQLGVGSLWTGKDTLLVSEGFVVAP